jgi:hypothetical protein
VFKHKKTQWLVEHPQAKVEYTPGLRPYEKTERCEQGDMICTEAEKNGPGLRDRDRLVRGQVEQKLEGELRSDLQAARTASAKNWITSADVRGHGNRQVPNQMAIGPERVG